MSVVQSVIRRHLLALLAVAGLIASLACGAGGLEGAGASGTGSTTTGYLAVVVSNTPSNRWAEVGVIIRGVALIPKGKTEADAVLVYDGSSDTKPTNLADLDGIGALMSQATLPIGTYDRALIKIDGKPSNIRLVPVLDADGQAQTAISSSQIQVNGTLNANQWVTLPALQLQEDLRITTGMTTSLRVVFDLSSPLFLVTHDESSPAAQVLTFQVRSEPLSDLTNLDFQAIQGRVLSVNSNHFALLTEHGQVQIFSLDHTNGTLFFDLDAAAANLPATMTSPTTLAIGKNVKVQARYQSDGSLGAVRSWISSYQTKLTSHSLEGHMAGKVANGFALDAQGERKDITVNDSTQYFFHGGLTPIGTGAAFLGQIHPGSKIELFSVEDPSATPLVAKQINLQNCGVEGSFQSATTTSFSLQKSVLGSIQTYALDYASGFSWNSFASPTTSPNLQPFIAQANASGTYLHSSAFSTLNWDGTQLKMVAAKAMFTPSTLSMESQQVSTGYANGAMTISYTYVQPGQTAVQTTLSVDLSQVAQVTKYTRNPSGSNSLVTVSTVPSTEWATALAAGAKVRAFGVPNSNGTLSAAYVNIFE